MGILKMSADSFAEAVDRIEPGSLALLDLSVRQGIDDKTIADLLGSNPEYVRSSRDDALDRIASAAGIDGEGSSNEVRALLAALPEERWPGRERPGAVATAPAPPPPLAPEPTPWLAGGDEGPSGRSLDEAAELAGSGVLRPGAKRRRRGPGILLALSAILIAGAVVAVVALSGGDEGDESASPSAREAPSQPAAQAPPRSERSAPAAERRRVRIRALGGDLRPTRATATVRDGRLRVSIAGLTPPQGVYQVWLFNSVADAVPVARSTTGTIDANVKLPKQATRYRYLDVSVEPADGNPNHGGESVLRAPLVKLLP